MEVLDARLVTADGAPVRAEQRNRRGAGRRIGILSARGAGERNRLEHLNPFPSEANYQQMKKHLENYGAALDKLKAELKLQMIVEKPLAPNEFQSRLRQAMIETTEKARVSRVKLRP